MEKYKRTVLRGRPGYALMPCRGTGTQGFVRILPGVLSSVITPELLVCAHAVTPRMVQGGNTSSFPPRCPCKSTLLHADRPQQANNSLLIVKQVLFKVPDNSQEGNGKCCGMLHTGI